MVVGGSGSTRQDLEGALERGGRFYLTAGRAKQVQRKWQAQSKRAKRCWGLWRGFFRRADTSSFTGNWALYECRMFHILVKRRHDEDESSVDGRHVERVEKVELASLDRHLVFLESARSRLEPSIGPLKYY